jgi:hypothetical protein
MFVQVIQGEVSDETRVHEQFDRWMRELSGGAKGWLGSTCGVTEDGTLVAMVRFESEQDARRNSDRPEQGQWWTETSRLFTNGASFMDCADASMDVHGDPDSAQFVQVIEGRTSDPERSRQFATRDMSKWADFRPDVIGSVQCDFPTGEFAREMFFTSEADARKGEQKEPPPELKAEMDEMMTLSAEPPKYYDLRHPWMYTPGKN